MTDEEYEKLKEEMAVLFGSYMDPDTGRIDLNEEESEKFLEQFYNLPERCDIDEDDITVEEAQQLADDFGVSFPMKSDKGD